MNENLLTKILVENLESGQVKKIVKNKINNSSINYYREIGDGSFRADIFITLTKKLKKKTDLIAIEVKIKDWKQGLYQAWRYNSFAEKSFLAIYKKFSKGIDIKMFEEYNVGLIIFDEKNIVVKNIPKNNSFKEQSYSIKLRNNLLSKTCNC